MSRNKPITSLDARMEIKHEPDERMRMCDVYFGDSLLTVMNKTGLVNILPSLILGAVKIRHWFLVFDFGDRSVVCEDNIDLRNTNGGSYSVWDPTREKDLIFLNTIITSPAVIHRWVVRNKYNGQSYSVNDRSCQDWIIQLGRDAGVHGRLKLAIAQRFRQNLFINLLITAIKSRYGKIKDNLHLTL